MCPPGRSGTLVGMTNDMRQTVTTRTTDTCGTIGRRTGRAFTVAAGAVGPLLLWAVNDPWAGLDIAVRQGATTRHIGPVAVVLTGLVAGLAAWGLLAVLERTVRRPARTFRIVALVVLVLSLTGPVSGGVGTGSRLALLGMHLTVGAALIIGLPCRRPGAGDARRF
jgi:hypothetical protein